MPASSENDHLIIKEADRRRVRREGYRVRGRRNLAQMVAAGTINSPPMRNARKGGATGRRG